MATKEMYSDFWLGDTDNLTSKSDKLAKTVELIAIKRAIGNFVRIVTNLPIPVVFAGKGKTNYTDGKMVVLDAALKPTKIDCHVGLALHEGSHIKLSDFPFLQKVMENEDKFIPAELYALAQLKGYVREDVKQTVQMLMNVIEDRRIDSWMYLNAPGYRPYYDAMYDEYFLSPEIDKKLYQGEYNEPTLENYIQLLINMTNRFFRKDALPGLDKMVATVDLRNIRRFDADKRWPIRKDYNGNLTAVDRQPKHVLPQLFTTTLDLASQIFDVLPMGSGKSHQDKKGKQGPGNGGKKITIILTDDCKGGQGGQPIDLSDYDEIEVIDQRTKKGEESGEEAGKSQMEIDSTVDANGKPLSKSEQKKLAKAIAAAKAKKAEAEQKKFTKGNVSKKGLTGKEQNEVNSAENSGTTIEEVGKTITGKPMAKVIVVRKLTREVLDNPMFPFSHNYGNVAREESTSRAAVVEGTRMGSILARRLLVRNEKDVTKFNRQNKGHIDRHQLHQLGYDMEQVFERIVIDQHKPVYVHLDIDASGSMSGDKWQRSLTVAVALAKAAETIKNLRVEVAIRAGGEGSYAYVCICYDSAVDKFAKVRSLFPYLRPGSSTPEGLCFEALMKHLLADQNEHRYFVNFSDGEPAFTNYHGEVAVKHTREQVNKMRSEGIKVLSYFIEDNRGYNSYGYGTQNFKGMYGKSSLFIDVAQICAVVKTLNDMFLQK